MAPVLVRVFLGRDRATRKRRYHSRMVRGPVRHAQTYLNKVLREHDLGHGIQGADITLNEYLDRWLETAAKTASAGEKLPQLRKPASPICAAIARRPQSGGNLPARYPGGLPTVDRARSVSANHPLNPLGSTLCHATGDTVAVAVA